MKKSIYSNKIGLFCCAAMLASAAGDRIVQPVDPGRTVTIRGQVHPAARPEFDRGALAGSFEINYATLLLAPAAGLEDFLAEQQNPASANFRRWLTPDQFADRFGLSTNDIAKVTGWLRSQGLTVNDVAHGRHWITFSGSASRISAALHTEFHRYLVNGETHFANSTNPSVPAALSGVVAGFTGLNDFRLKPAVLNAAYTTGGANFLAPEDIETIYDIAPLYPSGIDGTGQKIAVVGQTDVILPDLRNFRKKFNLPPNDPQMILIGTDPGVTSDLVEADLDLEWSAAIAPQATVIFVYSLDVALSAQYAVDENVAPVISMSYGGCELANQPAMRVIAQQANAQGITWVAASGDQGATTCDMFSTTPQASLGLTASFPASIPEITAVGATQFNEGSGTYWSSTNDANLGSALSFIPEIAWNGSALRHEIAATGGAASAFFTKPVWQAGLGVPNDGARDVPDVAFAGSPDHDGYLIVTGGATAVVGGTSAPTPVFAGILALLNQSLITQGTLAQPGLGNINPLLYRLAQSTTDVFHDVTMGNNQIPCEQGSPACVNGLAGYLAGPGYDLTTGLGSIDVAHLATEWTSGTASTTTLTANPTSYNLTDTVQLNATVSGAGATQPTGTVTFLAGDISLGTATLNGESATLGVSGILIASSTGVVTALYSGDGVYNPSAATATATLILPPSGSLAVPVVSPNPVNQSITDWPYTVALVEKAGVATKLTGFTINGVAQNLSFWSSTNLPAHGIISANLAATGITPPLSRDYHFTGIDAGGATWTRDLTVPFLGPAGPPFVPALTLITASSVAKNPQAGASCAWSQTLTLQETSGFLFLLTGFDAANTDLSNSIQALFGTTRLAPYATLEGTICWTSATQPGSVTYQINAESELGTTVSVESSSSLTPAATQPAAMSVSPPVAEMLAANSSESGSAAVNLSFSSTANWTVTVAPSRAASWLKVSPLSGQGSAQLSLQASAAGLSNGVYDATLLIQSPGSIPELAPVRVVFVVGASGSLTVDSVTNAASGSAVLAPGAMATVSGSNLSPAAIGTGRFPLALSLGGVSATVNGITAPLYSVSPNSLSIQIPYETGTGTAVLGITNNGLVTSYLFQVQVAAPAIFTTPDGFLNPTTTATPGQAISAFVTGEGDVTPFLPTGATPATGTAVKNLPRPILNYVVIVGGVNAPISFIGVPPGLAGVTQINFTVPPNAPTGVQPVIVTIPAMAVLVPVGGAPPAPAGAVVILNATPETPPASLNIVAPASNH